MSTAISINVVGKHTQRRPQVDMGNLLITLLNSVMAHYDRKYITGVIIFVIFVHPMALPAVKLEKKLQDYSYPYYLSVLSRELEALKSNVQHYLKYLCFEFQTLKLSEWTLIRIFELYVMKSKIQTLRFFFFVPRQTHGNNISRYIIVPVCPCRN